MATCRGRTGRGPTGPAIARDEAESGKILPEPSSSAPPLLFGHIADIHVRDTRREEYAEVFRRLADDMAAVSSERGGLAAIAVAGDIFDTMTRASAANWEDVAALFEQLAAVAPVIVLPGNHDMNMQTRGADGSRDDLLTPLFEAAGGARHLQPPAVTFWRQAGVYRHSGAVWVAAPPDSALPDPARLAEALDEGPAPVVALFHETVGGADFANGIRAEDGGRLPRSYLAELGRVAAARGQPCAVMLGDIHLRQEVPLPGADPAPDRRGCRVWYPGSLVCQNFGESHFGHGWLLWELSRGVEQGAGLLSPHTRSASGKLEDGDRFPAPAEGAPLSGVRTPPVCRVEPREIYNPKAVLTLELRAGADVTPEPLPEHPRAVRLRYDAATGAEALAAAVHAAEERYGLTLRSIEPASRSAGGQEDWHEPGQRGAGLLSQSGSGDEGPPPQDKNGDGGHEAAARRERERHAAFIRGMFASQPDLSEAVLARHERETRRLGPAIAAGRAELVRLEFDDLYCYGPGNVLDFERGAVRRGLAGLVAPNRAGKSSLFDILAFAMSDATPRGSKQNLARSGSEGYRVRLVFRLDGREGVVEKSGRARWARAARPIRLWYGGEELTGATASETARLARALLGDPTHIDAVAFMRPAEVTGRRPFALLDPAARRGLLSDLLRLGVFAELKKALDREVADLRAEMRGLCQGLRQAHAAAENAVAPFVSGRERKALMPPAASRKGKPLEPDDFEPGLLAAYAGLADFLAARREEQAGLVETLAAEAARHREALEEAAAHRAALEAAQSLGARLAEEKDTLAAELASVRRESAENAPSGGPPPLSYEALTSFLGASQQLAHASEALMRTLERTAGREKEVAAAAEELARVCGGAGGAGEESRDGFGSAVETTAAILARLEEQQAATQAELQALTAACARVEERARRAADQKALSSSRAAGKGPDQKAAADYEAAAGRARASAEGLAREVQALRRLLPSVPAKAKAAATAPPSPRAAESDPDSLAKEGRVLRARATKARGAALVARLRSGLAGAFVGGCPGCEQADGALSAASKPPSDYGEDAAREFIDRAVAAAQGLIAEEKALRRQAREALADEAERERLQAESARAQAEEAAARGQMRQDHGLELEEAQKKISGLKTALSETKLALRAAREKAAARMRLEARHGSLKAGLLELAKEGAEQSLHAAACAQSIDPRHVEAVAPFAGEPANRKLLSSVASQKLFPAFFTPAAGAEKKSARAVATAKEALSANEAAVACVAAAKLCGRSLEKIERGRVRRAELEHRLARVERELEAARAEERDLLLRGGPLLRSAGQSPPGAKASANGAGGAEDEESASPADRYAEARGRLALLEAAELQLRGVLEGEQGLAARASCHREAAAYRRVLDPRRGLASSLLGEARELLASRINESLRLMGASFAVELAPDFDLVLAEGDCRLPPALGSGYQQFVLELAARTALAALARVPLPACFLIDEGFGCLDEGNLVQVGEALSLLASRERAPFTLAVTHREDLRPYFSNILSIERAGGASLIRWPADALAEEPLRDRGPQADGEPAPARAGDVPEAEGPPDVPEQARQAAPAEKKAPGKTRAAGAGYRCDACGCEVSAARGVSHLKTQKHLKAAAEKAQVDDAVAAHDWASLDEAGGKRRVHCRLCNASFTAGQLRRHVGSPAHRRALDCVKG